MSARLTDQTADRIFQMIISDPHLGPGQKLPNEAELCELFGVSRTTLREAVRSLAAQGYVEVRRGRGTFVADRTNFKRDIGLSQLESVRLRLQDLFEIRMMIEPPTAMLACARGTDEEIAEIIRCAREVAHCIHTGGDWANADLVFHHAFVTASHNQFMEQLIPIINKAIADTWSVRGTHQLLPGTVLRDNEMLVDYLEKRDAQGARFAMACHIRHIINLLDFEPDAQPSSLL